MRTNVLRRFSGLEARTLFMACVSAGNTYPAETVWRAFDAAVSAIRNCSASSGARVIYDGCFLRLGTRLGLIPFSPG